MTPIIMYHALSDDVVSNKYTLTAEKFRQHLSIIKSAGKTGISLTNLYKNKTENNVIITFDDGHISDISIALPILKEFDFTATFFITTDRVNNGDKWMKWDDLKEMLTQGMDIQAHGHTHRFLDTNSHELLMDELSLPKKYFTEKLSHDIQHFSLPGGRYCKLTLEVAKKLGYLTISTSIPGMNDFVEKKNIIILRRFVIHQSIGDNEFRSIIDGKRIYYHIKTGKYLIKDICKKILGNNLYQKLWEIRMK
jgi:peptidoglycan/xylan/chitin deacetylase (PgdA/CDA1 family)